MSIRSVLKMMERLSEVPSKRKPKKRKAVKPKTSSKDGNSNG
ncbi:hypothetical protein M2401_005523 [Pseudomonas sp. JUb42]|nr:hypothetical protein [Pseudomonas sp. JUb42]